MRNPLDVIPSHVTLINTTSHSMQLKGQTYHETFPEYWDWIMKREVNFIKNFFKSNRETSCKAVPTYYVRYEDLLIDPKKVVTELFCFLFEVPSLEGTVLEAQIARNTADLDSKAIYKLKTKTRSLCRSAHMYTPEQLQNIKTELLEFLYFFDYVKTPEKPDNPTAFFDYSEDHQSGPDLSKETFRDCNKKVLD
jgi:hypothetical protein